MSSCDEGPEKSVAGRSLPGKGTSVGFLIPARLETQLGHTGCARSPLIPTYIYSARFSAHMYKKTLSLSILFRCFDYIPDPKPHYPLTT